MVIEDVKGAGKTHTACRHIQNLLDSGVSAAQLLIIVPDPVLAAPYKKWLSAMTVGNWPALLTFDDWVKGAVQANWALLSPQPQPSILPDWRAQALLEEIGSKFLDAGPLQGLRASRQQIISQIFSTARLSACAGFEPAAGFERLSRYIGGRRRRLYKICGTIYADGVST